MDRQDEVFYKPSCIQRGMTGNTFDFFSDEHDRI